MLKKEPKKALSALDLMHICSRLNADKKCCNEDMVIETGNEIAWASCPICQTEYDWE